MDWASVFQIASVMILQKITCLFPPRIGMKNYFCFCFVGGVILRFLSVVAKFQVLFPSIVFKCSFLNS